MLSIHMEECKLLCVRSLDMNMGPGEGYLASWVYLPFNVI